MKFDLPEDQVKIDFEKAQVQLPFKLFSDLVNYVEDLEAKLLARDINLQEAEELTAQMEDTLLNRDAQSPRKLSREDVEQLGRVAALFEDPERPLLKEMRRKKMSIRQLAATTDISYATIYRYIHGRFRPDIKKATKILRAIDRTRESAKG